MTHSVELTQLFKEDLADIWLFLDERNSDVAAHRTTNAILRGLEVLADWTVA